MKVERDQVGAWMGRWRGSEATAPQSPAIHSAVHIAVARRLERTDRMNLDPFVEEADDVIGGCWGNHITWSSQEMFQFGKQGTFSAYAHKPVRQEPKIGHKVSAEFEKSWILFEITDVERSHDPKDMFFLKLRPLIQQIKETGERHLSSVLAEQRQAADKKSTKHSPVPQFASSVAEWIRRKLRGRRLSRSSRGTRH